MFDYQKLKITPLGAGNEVGRSCIHIEYKQTQLLLDIGIHPAFTGPCALPFLDVIDLHKIDALFVTHFHLDHAGALPYLTEKTNFKGKIFMTHPTKSILKYLLNDYTKVVNASSNEDMYTEADLKNCYNKIFAIDYFQEIKIKDIKVVSLNAGHVLGAAMFLLKIGSKKLLYTGDYSTEPDRHLKEAKCPGKINFLITESTYGVQCHLPREEREKRFLNAVRDIIKRRGKVLLPVFALGRAQEILLILEEYWDNNEDLQNVPIYYASALARRCIGIYQQYSQSDKNVDFKFKYIRNINTFDDRNLPCVVMASPGMLQSGLSRDLFEKWCEDKRNGVIIAGYCVQGTLAKEILNEPEEVEGIAGNKLKLNCSVDCISFSAHVDYLQNKEFITSCDPEVLFLVHGEFNEMNRLKNALKRDNTFGLRNGEFLHIKIDEPRFCTIKNFKEDEIFDAIIIGKGDAYEIHRMNDVREFRILHKAKLSNFSMVVDKNVKEAFSINDYSNFLQQKNIHLDLSNTQSNFLNSANSENIIKEEKDNGKADSISLKDDKEEKIGCGLSNSNDNDINLNINQCDNQIVENTTSIEQAINEIQEKTPIDNSTLPSELLKSSDHQKILISSETISSKSKTTQKITSFMHLPYNAKLSLVKNCLYDFFDEITHTNDTLQIDQIKITLKDDTIITEWTANYVNDILANTIFTILKNIGKTINSIKLSYYKKDETLINLLKNYFVDVVVHDNAIKVVDGCDEAHILDGIVSGDTVIVQKVQDIVDSVNTIFG
ncbi:hypothetical protein EDEG_00447 [Edhazardia aedis USNM 41457]|uniref:Metallo-beta-lactamase domain-containing protein n=1 Tax=Edhazardia aedis (strain USNM 41457) TaxID=1003232 RepID=J9DFS6_EDHAE|nr:hypothetical protein EDEG_00447 [Edhazardia aedis USNM 41457]|eukprot:EJW01455.1 hypothetical protein EDEG_00447 [Edhazardia aedis USNM 41457]